MEADAGRRAPGAVALSTRVELFAADIDRSLAFYGELGFDVVRRWGGWALVDRRGARLAIQDDAYVRDHEHYFSPHIDRAPRGVGVEVTVDVADRDDLEALYAEAQRVGCVVRELRERPWGATDFRVADPDGYFVRFTTPLGLIGE
jgi:catechol 2,3-dioxygenase-like lactoylglutathione lyase family enzyme